MKNSRDLYKKGTVYLIGAGPGDIGLLTLRAASLLHKADVIVYDGLINNALLQYFPTAQKIYFGKRKKGAESQKEINQLLVDLAREGKMVARLKGGDPIVFARGSEEAQYLKEHHIPFEIVPGITSGHAVPAYAGIPVTDRHLSSTVIFVTGQEREDKEGSLIDWAKLAGVEGSLVIYMGVKNFPFIVKRLIEGGKPTDTLVSIIEAGTLPRQRLIEGTLKNIVQKMEGQRIESPAIIVIGEVNKLRRDLDWFDQELSKEREESFSHELEFARELTQKYETAPTHAIAVKNLKHGGDLEGFAAQIGKDKKSIIDFSSNINPLGISPKVKKVYEESLSCISQYPDTYAREFCQAISGHFSVGNECVITGNGAISLIDLAVRALRPQRALVIQPCFNEYKRILHLWGATVDQISLRDENDFQFSYDDIVRKLSGIDMILLGSPNNPTGTALKRDEMLALIKETERRGIFLVVDEAFMDWTPESSIYEEINRSSTLIVIRSLTKFFSLAGIRSGFALASPRIIHKMRSVQEPWSCNALAQRLSIAALEDLEFQKKSLQWFREESVEFYQMLSHVREIKVYPSLTNFFLIKLHDRDNRESLIASIKSKGMYIREMNDVEGLENHFFRIALKDRRENIKLIAAFKEALIKDQCLSS